MRLPPECYDAGCIATLVGIMSDTPSSLERLVVNFHGYDDAGGELLRYLPRFVRKRAVARAQAQQSGLDGVGGVVVRLQGLGYHDRQHRSLRDLGSEVEIMYGQMDEILWQFAHSS